MAVACLKPRLRATKHPLNDEIRYRLLKLLSENPNLSQRRLAEELGISVGKVNYCLKAVIEKGWVKMGNFARNPDKRTYAYLLTSKGIEEKARVTEFPQAQTARI